MAPRPKRSVTRKPAHSPVPSRSAATGEDEAHDSQRVKPSTLLTPYEHGFSDARSDANTGFWRDLGHDETLHRRLAQKKRVTSPRHDDVEELQEKYALHSNASSKRVLLLQYPERKSRALYCAENNQQPVEIRMKPKTGVIEVDIPLDITTHYSKTRGVEFGGPLRRSKVSHQNGAHGIAGGLDTAPPRPSFRGNDALMTDLPPSEVLDNFEESVSEGRVLDRFTLGGRIEPFKDGDPIHIIATFSGSECKWTKVDAIVQLRAQFTHLDALSADKRRLTSTLTEKSEDKIKEERIEDVNMIIKDTADSDNADMYGGMNETSRLLRSIRDEPWQRLQWTDSSTNFSRDIYQDNLVPQLPGDAPYLVAKMTGEQYLDAISCPRVDPVMQGKQITASLREDNPMSTYAIPGGALQDENEDDSEDMDWSDSTRYQVVDEPDSGKTSSRPSADTERTIERVCRMICLGNGNGSRKIEQRLAETFAGASKYSFLRPGHEHHAYFRWRLKRNSYGDGILPQYDYGKVP